MMSFYNNKKRPEGRLNLLAEVFAVAVKWKLFYH